MELLTSVQLGSVSSSNRVMFGPHATNLGHDRSISPRHLAYYERRARGGCGLIVAEEASVHESDWPYERAPLAGECHAGWSELAARCRPHGSLVLAA
ncbi:MAG: 2,4-dienoyl-CoA reductase, partial [Acidimicrobiales bacterium]